MAEQTCYGSVVAFEGNAETISTQLRLLPKAPQILVLPSIQTYLSKDRRKRPFEARRYIKEIHKAAETRLAVAREFLRDSTPDNKKLVFLNGGTVRAQALCISAISENQTARNLSRADVIFGQLIKDGVTGLSEDYRARRSRLLGLDRDVGTVTDPIIRAMRAAELLDSETASLQPSNDIDLTSQSLRRRRSLSLPIYRYSEHMEGALPFYVFGAQQDWDAISKRSSKHTLRDDLSIRSPLPVVDENSNHRTFLFPPRSPSCVGESYQRHSAVSVATTELLSPHSESFSASRPETPDAVVYGEACAIQLRSPSLRKAPKRSTSLDRATLRRTSHVEAVTDHRQPSKPSTESEFNTLIGSYILGSQGSMRSRGSYIDPPRTVFVRGRQSSQVTLDVPKSKFSNYRSSYVDRGTDAECEEDVTFRPVLPVTEDLIIYFSEHEHDQALDYVLQTYKDGSYPIQRSPPTSEVDDHIPTTPTSNHAPISDVQKYPWEPHPSVEITRAPSSQDGDYDPYVSDHYSSNTWVQQQSFKPVVTQHRRVEAPKPPTPDNTPPPSITIGFEKKLHEFNTVNCPTAVSMQNSLRSILSIYFPSEETGCHKFNFPLLPDMDGLWQPIFRETEGLASPAKGKSRVDQIIAIGSQKGVKKEFVSTITGQLEMLGSKQNGLSRSGRLDLRYLIASAMQVFTAQPLANQTQDNPFTNPYLLATLIIPHLETYLAMNPSILFLLLEYPPEHLATALALQKLVGVELLKVAGIINAETNMRSPASSVPVHSPSSSFVEGLSAISLPTSSRSKPKSSNLSSKPSPSSSLSKSFSGSLHLAFSKANFLLASCASEKELSNFVHTIWNILAESSSYYSIDQLPVEARGFLTPPQPKRDLSPPDSAGSAVPASSRTAVSQQERQHGSLAAKLLSPPMSPHIGTQKRPTTPLSQEQSFRSTKSIRSSKTQRERIKNLLGTSPPSSWTERGGLNSAVSIKSGKSGRSFIDDDDDDNDDGASSFFDFGDEKIDLKNEERRLMPLFEKRKVQKGSINGSKALRWLGIS